MQAQTKSAKRERIARLKERISDLKAGNYMGKYNPEIIKTIAWFENSYFRMPYHERIEHDAAWNEYYKKCGQSVEAELFREMAQACGLKDTNRIKELKQQAREMLQNGIVLINKPSGYDPMVWFNTDCFINYQACKKELDNLESEEEASLPAIGGTW